MVSIIETLVNRHDVIVYDSESHACIIDGCRLHFGKRFVFLIITWKGSKESWKELTNSHNKPVAVFW